MLKIGGIDVYYGDVQALWNVSLQVNKGEIVTLVGANGAGKTTTVKTISGLLKAARGSIEFEGERIDDKPAHEMASRGIAHVPEGRRLFPLMTVKENLEMGAMISEAKKHRGETLEQVYKILPRLKEREVQMAETLSGGEQQMLAIGRGIMARPRLLLLDEPSLGLAPILVQQIFDTIRHIHEEGVTLLLIEQNVRRALSIADRAYVLENGRIVLNGTGQELLESDHVKRAYLGL
ncbi:MAG: ABC transporter ATP-binding protein [Candidatus Tectomicrobia bacterium]|uniref:ABC transporter ATP-binding protein n=1 Tax=Tectimicrobiota bacterium TaxID=2528274 RepID=A0A932GR65_UNCTE|nr:ABC transporter ATP-binding protein [Candidatus Tectomicrobia bacterium]